MEMVVVQTDELKSIVQEAVRAALGDLHRKAVTDIMDVEDLMSYLKVPKSRIYQLTHSGAIPFSKRGRSLYFSRKEIEQWLENGKQVVNLKQEAIDDRRLERIQRKNKI